MDQGESVTLLCASNVTDIDPFRIDWRKDGSNTNIPNNVLIQRNRLNIDSTLPVNSGMYACGVTITDVVSNTVSLRVLEPGESLNYKVFSQRFVVSTVPPLQSVN